MKLTTTFKLLRKAGACSSRYRHLRESLPDVGDTDSINLLTILETNGLQDALWALRATAEDCQKVARLMAADFAESALPIWQKKYPDDKGPEAAIKAARDFANELIGENELGKARRAAAAAYADAAYTDAAVAAYAAAAYTDAAVAAAAAAYVAAFAVERSKQRDIFVSYLQDDPATR